VLNLNPGIAFAFASVKVDITPKKRAEVANLNEHTSMTVRGIASGVRVGKSSVSRIICAYKNSGSLFSSIKGNCGRKRKTLLVLIDFSRE
jgi:hypothetical protein